MAKFTCTFLCSWPLTTDGEIYLKISLWLTTNSRWRNLLENLLGKNVSCTTCLHFCISEKNVLTGPMCASLIQLSSYQNISFYDNQEIKYAVIHNLLRPWTVINYQTVFTTRNWKVWITPPGDYDRLQNWT